jgi:paraquat-inducible protein B
LQLGQDIDGEAVYDDSGSSVSLSADGKTVAIGAPGNVNGNGVSSGHVRVYKINSSRDFLQTTIAKQASKLDALAQADSEAQTTIAEQASKLDALAQADSEAQATIAEQASKLDALAQANSEAQTTIAQLAQDLQAMKEDISGQAFTIDEISSESSSLATPLAGVAAALACAGLVLAGLAWHGRSANIKSVDDFATEANNSSEELSKA